MENGYKGPEQGREIANINLEGNSVWELGKRGPTIGIYKDETSSTGYLIKGPFENSTSGFLELPVGLTSIGREGEIRLANVPQTVSRIHLEINNKGDGTYDVFDRSLNGTFRIEI